MSKLKDLDFKLIEPLPFSKLESNARLQEIREDNKFYSKCLHVLSKKRGKEKLIAEIKYLMRCCEQRYNYLDNHRRLCL